MQVVAFPCAGATTAAAVVATSSSSSSNMMAASLNVGSAGAFACVARPAPATAGLPACGATMALAGVAPSSCAGVTPLAAAALLALAAAMGLATCGATPVAVLAGGAATGLAGGTATASAAIVAVMPSTADNASTAAGLIFIVVVVLEYYDSPQCHGFAKKEDFIKNIGVNVIIA
jgi:hypothetical protein